MNEIGQILKARREELGYTLTKMSERTKVPVSKLQAIEEGNLAYFKNELSYVKFYVRYYFNSVHLNYDDYKDLVNASLDEYTNTMHLEKIAEINAINQRVKSRVKLNNKQKSQSSKVKKLVKVDFGFISLFVISVLIVIALVYVFISSVLPMLNKTKTNDPVINIPDPIVHNDETDLPEDPVVDVEFTITKTDTINYEISGYVLDEETTFIIQLPLAKSWLSSKVDGKSTSTPARRYYEKGESYTLIVNAQDDRIVELYIGYLASPTITINGTIVTIDETLVSSKNKSSFFFTFKGVRP